MVSGRVKSATEAEESTEEEVIENDLLAEAILSQIGKDDLMEAVEFENEEAGYSFASAIGAERWSTKGCSRIGKVKNTPGTAVADIMITEKSVIIQAL